MRRPTFLRFLERPKVLVGRKVKLRSKCFEDTLDDYRWRQDEELCRLDAAMPLSISLEDFQKLMVEQPIYSRGSCQFAIVTLDNKHIGNCSYFNIDPVNRQAEIGIMIGEKEYWDQGYGAEAMIITLNYIFRYTDLDRVHLKTLEWNIRAQKCFKKCGFNICGNLTRGEHDFILMEIYRTKKKDKVESLLRR